MILTLVGYRGSGKSTVARLLAEKFDVQSVDTDAMVEKLAGQTIAAIFEADGESEFRRLETQAIKMATAQSSGVIAVGGGAVLSEENRQLMKEAGSVVWLTAPAEVLAARISNDANSASQRPSLTGKAIEAEVAEVLQNRLPFYELAADHSVDVSHQLPEEIAEEIFQWASRSAT